MTQPAPCRKPDLPSSKQILGLAIPALIALAAEPLLGLLDSAFVGSLGSAPLAALGAANTILNACFALLIFLEYGTTARLSRRVGAGQLHDLAAEAVQLGWLSTLLGAGLFLVLTLGGPTLLRALGVQGEVLELATTYLAIRALAAIPSLWIRAGNGIFRGLLDNKTPMQILLAMNVGNALLDWVLIFGVPSLGIPAMGLKGAAWASALVTVVSGLAFAAVLFWRLRNYWPTTWSQLQPSPGILLELIGVSRDLLLRTLGLQIALVCGARMAAWLGEASLAAHHVGWQLWSFLALLLDSLAITGQSMVGKALGAGAVLQARQVGNRLCRWGLGLGVVCSAAFLALQPWLPSLFSQDPAVLQQVRSVFWLISLLQLPNSVLFVLDGLLIGASDFRFLRNSMFALGIFGAATIYAMGTWTRSLEGIWMAIGLLMLARLLVMGLRWRSSGWELGNKTSLSHQR